MKGDNVGVTWGSIASVYMKALIDPFRWQSIQKATSIHMGGTSVVKYNMTKPLATIEVKSSDLHDMLTDVQIKYHTRLWKGVQKAKCESKYYCHCIGAPRWVHPCTLRRCGHCFHVEIRVNDEVNHATMTILVYGCYGGHVPVSWRDMM